MIILFGIVLKIPVGFAIWLVWWASRSYDELEDGADGASDHGFRRWRRQPKHPRGPRRGGPHGGTAIPPADCPPGGRRRMPQLKPGVASGAAAHERR